MFVNIVCLELPHTLIFLKCHGEIFCFFLKASWWCNVVLLWKDMMTYWSIVGLWFSRKSFYGFLKQLEVKHFFQLSAFLSLGNKSNSWSELKIYWVKVSSLETINTPCLRSMWRWDRMQNSKIWPQLINPKLWEWGSGTLHRYPIGSYPLQNLRTTFLSTLASEIRCTKWQIPQTGQPP